ncbi:MAG: hypothetical protein AAFX99_10020 [Myxococcota bacterium]
MINRIKGGPPGPDAVEATEATQATEGTEAVPGFDAVMSQHEVSAVQELSTADPAVMGVIDGVASDLKTGALATPDAALEAVVERLVDVRFEHLDPSVRRQMSDDLREVLLDDPFFVLEVEELIGHALEHA